MSYDADYLYALQLQDEWEKEENETNDWPTVQATSNANKRRIEDDDKELNSTQNLVHPDWETIDPTPDIFSLFGAFDIKFFQGKLQCVELEWSKRMYQCAGICYQRRNQMGMSVTIRLSEPLLKLRSRRNLIETMLHEMIHAYLFIQNIREGNGGHGPNFKRIMENINRVAGTNITVYHTFHDEVALYKTHIWRCNGICQHRKPFYGWVKRTMNRAPGPSDNWWAKHHDTCAGTFVKLSEPEPKKKAKKAKIEETNLPKITNWLNSSQDNAVAPKSTVNQPRAPFGNSNLPRTGAGGFTKMNGGGTVVLKPTAKNRSVSTVNDNNSGSILSSVSDGAPGGHLRNVVGFRDLNDSGTSSVIQKPTFGSRGHVLGATSSTMTSGATPIENIRNIWANRFNDQSNNQATATATSASTESNRPSNKNKVIESSSAWEEIDDDILIHSVQNTVIEIDDGSNDGISNAEAPARQSTCENETPISIKKELLDDLGEEDENIEMIDDEFDDDMNESLEILTDTSVIDELFGTDTLMADFNNINDVVMNDPENIGNPNMEIVQCPICEDRMPRGDLSSHLDGCNGITIKINPKKRGEKLKPFYKNQAKPTNKQLRDRDKELLRAAGYTPDQIERLSKENQEAKDYNDRIMDEMAHEERHRRTTVITQNPSNDIETIALDDESSNSSAVPEKLPCPVCSTQVDANQINQHLDECLQANF